MASKVEVKTGGPLRVWDREDSQLVVAEMHRRIVLRTRGEHVGADGRPFRPYANPKRKGKPAGPVDLTRSGAMIDTLAERATDTRASLTATVPYARRQDMMRPWLGFTEAELDALFRSLVLPEVDEAIRESNSKAVVNG
jgi:hypothetical protein